MHGQGVHQLAGRGAHGPTLKHREGERRVVRRDVQLEGGVHADQQVDGPDDQLAQAHGPHQGLQRVDHLGEQGERGQCAGGGGQGGD